MFSEDFSISVSPLITQYGCVNAVEGRHGKLDSIPFFGFDLKQLRDIPLSGSSDGPTYVGPLFS